jgi:hypothetical protein
VPSFRPSRGQQEKAMLFMTADSQESPFGGNFEGLILPCFTTRTKLREFRPAQSPLHFSSLYRLSSSLKSGTHKPDLNSFSSASFLSASRSSARLAGLPGRLWDLRSSSSSSSLATKLVDFQHDFMQTKCESPTSGLRCVSHRPSPLPYYLQ